jgi:adenosylcobinamide-GDP ribazoletransferase
MKALRAVRAATIFLTRVPVGGFPFSEEEWRWAPSCFPVVGLAVGVLLAAVHAGLVPLGPWPAAILTVAVGLLVTGAFHEDGLADSADALGGATHEPERLLEILKDSRIGTFGASALFLSLLLRVALLVSLGPQAGLGLILCHALARVGPVGLIARHPYVTDPGRARSSGVAQARAPQARLAAGLGAAVLAVAWVTASIPAVAVLLLVVVLGLVAWVSGRFYVARAGGITGDFLGATEQLGEIAVLVVLVALA